MGLLPSFTGANYFAKFISFKIDCIGKQGNQDTEIDLVEIGSRLHNH